MTSCITVSSMPGQGQNKAGRRKQDTVRAAHTPSPSALPLTTAHVWKRGSQEFITINYTFWSSVICRRILVTLEMLVLGSSCMNVHSTTKHDDNMVTNRANLGETALTCPVPEQTKGLHSLGCPEPPNSSRDPEQTLLCSASFITALPLSASSLLQSPLFRYCDPIANGDKCGRTGSVTCLTRNPLRSWFGWEGGRFRSGMTGRDIQLCLSSHKTKCYQTRAIDGPVGEQGGGDTQPWGCHEESALPPPQQQGLRDWRKLL